MKITAIMVKELREKTGAGMMNCKQALVENEGDFEAATTWLRKKGIASAEKKSDRLTAEGLTAIAISGQKAAAIEINSETDFVSRNESFQKLVKEVANKAVNVSDIDELKKATTDSGKTIAELVTENIAIIGENLTLRRMRNIKVDSGVISAYVHNHSAENMGKIAVLVALESAGDQQKLAEIGKQLAMHIAASKPLGLTESDISHELIEKEREILTAQAKASGKPENIIEKIVAGGVRKFLAEITLLEQNFIMDNKVKINGFLQNAEKELGTTIKIKDFVRFELGEGIEKQVSNFAEEVSLVAKS